MTISLCCRDHHEVLKSLKQCHDSKSVIVSFCFLNADLHSFLNLGMSSLVGKDIELENWMLSVASRIKM